MHKKLNELKQQSVSLVSLVGDHEETGGAYSVRSGNVYRRSVVLSFESGLKSLLDGVTKLIECTIR